MSDSIPSPTLTPDPLQEKKIALTTAKRALAILEEQAAGYGSLAIPPHLKIQLEDKRKEVADLEKELQLAEPSGDSKPEPPQNSDDAWVGGCLLLLVIALVLWYIWPNNGPSTPDDIVKQNPADFVIQYYQLVNDHKYKEAWNVLSPKYKQEKGPGYSFEEYKASWEDISAVNVQEISVTYQTAVQAIVKVHVLYAMKDGQQYHYNFCIGLDDASMESSWLLQSSWYADDCSP